jgi:iron complex transport system substrate-binding protein
MRDAWQQLRVFRFSLFAALLVLPAASLLFAASRGAIADAVSNSAAPVYDSSRIVSIGGSITEILYALGAQQKIVAVDTTSLYPPIALREKPNVGYMRQLSAEGVLGLSPTLILAIEGAGPKETIDVLQQAKVAFVSVPDNFTADGIIDKIDAIARDVGVPGRGKCLADEVRRDNSALEAMRGQIRQPVKVAFVLSLANGRPMLAGRGTAADGIIAMAGASNAFDDFDGYKMVNDEAIIAAKPGAILAMQSGEHALSADTVFSQPALAMTPAAKGKTLISMDGLYLLGFGPRTARAARDLAMRLYPNIAAGTLPSEQRSGAVSCDR